MNAQSGATLGMMAIKGHMHAWQLTPLPGKVQMFLVERIPFEASGPEIGVQGRGLFVVQPALSNWVLS